MLPILLIKGFRRSFEIMLFAVLRRLLVLLTGLAFLGGTTVQAMPSVLGLMSQEQAQTAMGDCARMAMHEHATPMPTEQVPCNGITPDCIKQMGCIGFASLPTRISGPGNAVSYGTVSYWLRQPTLGGLSPEPDLSPPITA